MLDAGDIAPDFELPDAEMDLVRLADLRATHHVVLFFYPRDDTPASTLEAVDFSDHDDALEACGAVAVGISMDDVLSHGAFRDRHGLSVRLLSDTDGEVCARYGVLEERPDGHGGMRRAIRRSTFLIDRGGRIRHALHAVEAKGHVRTVLALLKELR
ncbi:MAG: peroxiredoxin [Burkholderiales bacterium]|jgi:thioredoxin-dependent peroxiredoxin|nr:peroxiredoxin [Burkholderiales bacterium]